ncbi:MAG: hypothetical protein QOF33_4474 [Thermomicrobiales bacterium]|jgi:uncharacterized protein with GYD domain|nr:hypothetical protein [Thermomicrobiales bacterium]
MARYVVLIDWTDQGIRNAKDSVDRVRQAREAFQKQGITIESIYWTLGSHDLVAVMSAPDGETFAAALLQLGGAGNVRTTTLRAFDEGEFGVILGKLG